MPDQADVLAELGDRYDYRRRAAVGFARGRIDFALVTTADVLGAAFIVLVAHFKLGADYLAALFVDVVGSARVRRAGK